MPATSSDNQKIKSIKVRFISIGVLVFLFLMIISNPSEKSFRRYLSEYVHTESGSTLPEVSPNVYINFQRSNYYLFSSYQVKLNGEAHEYLGIFGTFRKY